MITVRPANMQILTRDEHKELHKRVIDDAGEVSDKKEWNAKQKKAFNKYIQTFNSINTKI